MPSLRQIRRRIRSVENTKKITRAMEMVAAAKLRRFEDLLARARESADFLENLLGRLLADVRDYDHPLFRAVPEPKRFALLVVASDTGLCGTYNANVLARAAAFLKDRSQSGKGGASAPSVEVVPVGKNAVNYFRRLGHEVKASFVENRLSNFEATAEHAAEHLKDRFLAGAVDEVYLLYTKYVSKAQYGPKLEKFLNLEKSGAEGKPGPGYILEPDAGRIFDALLPKFLWSKIRAVLLESFLSEQLSRMMAMRQATDNAAEMIEEMTLLRNKLRQAAITKELIEVVSGAKALKR
ncbi:MAG: ATP synthase F1 subunit gamma [Candidatus Omnitrophica bacterium]|nr:ATP synthase F1 subunit gamma [Candidatus Omnitrophota bacterium]